MLLIPWELAVKQKVYYKKGNTEVSSLEDLGTFVNGTKKEGDKEDKNEHRQKRRDKETQERCEMKYGCESIR